MNHPSQQLETLVSSRGLEQIRQDESLMPLGSIVLGTVILDFPGGGTPKTVELNEQQRLIALFASFGGTTEQVARILTMETEEVAQTRDEFLAIYEVETMAAVTYQMVRRRQMPVEPQRKAGFQNPNRIGLTILNGIARGESNGKIGKDIGVSKQDFKPYLDGLLYHLRANGRTHAMRQVHVTGTDISPEAIRRAPKPAKGSIVQNVLL